MDRGYSAAQIRAAEQPLLDAGVPLMERAAAGLAKEIRRELQARASIDVSTEASTDVSTDGAGRDPQVLLLVGSGNNGGDALFAGALLAAEGIDVAILAVGSRIHKPGLAAALGAGASLETVDTDADAAALALRLARTADVVVDAILGIGVSTDPRLRGRARSVVAALIPELDAARAGNRAALVVAVDIPSGIDADTGAAADSTILPASVTVTFGARKTGLLHGAGARLAGEVRLVDVGLTLPDER